MFSGLFLVILNLFRAVSFLMLQFHVSPLKVHLHFQESQAISGISSLKLFLDFLSLHTFVVIFFGNRVCKLLSYDYLLPTKCSEQTQRSKFALKFSPHIKWSRFFTKYIIVWNNIKQQTTFNFEIIVAKRHTSSETPFLSMCSNTGVVCCRLMAAGGFSIIFFMSRYTSITKAV